MHEVMNRYGSLTVAGAALFAASFVSQSAQAAGLAAGTVITNTATATYTSGSTSSTVSSNPVTVRVNQLIDVAVTGLNSAPVPASSSPAVLSYSITNTGNGPSTFTLSPDANVSGNAYNGTVQTIAIDSNGNGVYDSGVDTVYTTGAATPSIAADGSIRVFLVVALPGSGASDGQVSQIKLTAISSIGSGSPGSVITGGGTGGVDAVIGSSGGSANANNSIIASLGAVSLVKAVTSVANPFGGSSPVPGSIVTFSITSHVTGSSTATNLHITDTIPSGTTYQAGSLTLGGTVLTDGADADAGQGSQASGIDVGLGNVAGGSADQVVTFRVRIN
jgi:uncharacterized repeat protein (TIGR01451 family)